MLNVSCVYLLEWYGLISEARKAPTATLETPPKVDKLARLQTLDPVSRCCAYSIQY